jgi:hypothetical protein
VWIWKERRDKWMLAGAATVFALIVLINLKLEVWPVIK